MYTRKQRMVAFIACAAFLLVTLCSIFFIEKEANHVCTGEDCPVCAQISEAESTLKKLGNGALSVNFVNVCTSICFSLAMTGSIYAVLSATPVTQKVRMND